MITNEMTTQTAQTPQQAEKHETMVHYVPKVDVWEDETALHMTAIMPGVKAENVEITMEGDELRIYGRSAWQAPQGMKLIYEEYEEGDYERAFALSDRVDREGIEANFAEGVLTVKLPKVAEARPVRIPVKAS